MTTIQVTMPVHHFNAIRDALRERARHHQLLERRSKRGWAKTKHESFARRYLDALDHLDAQRTLTSQ